MLLQLLFSPFLLHRSAVCWYLCKFFIHSIARETPSSVCETHLPVKKRTEIISPQINRRIGQAMHDYSLLADRDRVLVAVSGGIDSLLLAWLLNHWQKKAPIGYSLHCVHIDMGIWNEEMAIHDPVIKIREQLEKIELSLLVERSLYLNEAERTCFTCSKLRRKQLLILPVALNVIRLLSGTIKMTCWKLFLSICSTVEISPPWFQGKSCLKGN